MVPYDLTVAASGAGCLAIPETFDTVMLVPQILDVICLGPVPTGLACGV